MLTSLASGSELSRVISNICFICYLFSLDHGSAEEASENFARLIANN
jgi:hypothetical protein